MSKEYCVKKQEGDQAHIAMQFLKNIIFDRFEYALEMG